MKLQRFLIATVVSVACLASAATAEAGYAHYFRWLAPPSDGQLTACVADMQRVVKAASDQLAGPDGEGAIPSDARVVKFNGQGSEAREPFIFPGAPAGLVNSCKTQSRPYDAAVTACLIVARDHFPPQVLEISSDGQWDAGDWREGARLYRRVFDRRANSPISTAIDDETDVVDPRFAPPDGAPLPNGQWDPLSGVILVAIALGVAWMILRPHWSLAIEVVNSRVERVRGVGKRRLLLDIDDLCRQAEIPHGWIREMSVAGRRRLVITGAITPECRQRIRNVWTAHLRDPRK